ncbi:MAG: hypothetical protein ABIB47_05535 [Candidatus Woesearchaeota archaeon]
MAILNESGGRNVPCPDHIPPKHMTPNQKRHQIARDKTVKELVVGLERLAECIDIQNLNLSRRPKTRLMQVFKRDPRGWHALAIELLEYVATTFGINRGTISSERYANLTLRQAANLILEQQGRANLRVY